MPQVVCTKVELYGANSDGSPRRYVVADGTQISKGVLLELQDPRTAVAMTAVSATAARACAGIASHEKEANDGSTSISAWTEGVFLCRASGAIIIGEAVIGLINGYVAAAGTGTTAASGAVILGYAMHTASNNEQINVRVRL